MFQVCVVIQWAEPKVCTCNVSVINKGSAVSVTSAFLWVCIRNCMRFYKSPSRTATRYRLAASKVPA